MKSLFIFLIALFLTLEVNAQVCKSDYDHSGKVDINDMLLFSRVNGKAAGHWGYDPRVDVDGSKAIDFPDLLALGQDFNKVCKAHAFPFELIANHAWKDVPAPQPLTYAQPSVDLPKIFSGEAFIFSHDCLWPGSYPNYDYTRGDETKIRTCVRRMKDGTFTYGVFDTEKFKIIASVYGEAKARSEAQKLKDLITWAKDESAKYKPEKKVKFGHYDTFPMSDYWTLLAYGKCVRQGMKPEAQCQFDSNYHVWVKNNEILMPFAENVDFVAPSIYMGAGENLIDWGIVTEETVRFSNRYAVPVLPYIWDHHHEAGPMAGQPISGQFWKGQLDILLRLSAGAIWWSNLERYSDVQKQGFYAETLKWVKVNREKGVLKVNPRAAL